MDTAMLHHTYRGYAYDRNRLLSYELCVSRGAYQKSSLCYSQYPSLQTNTRRHSAAAIETVPNRNVFCLAGQNQQ